MDTGDVLERVRALSLSEWSNSRDAKSARHLGPMAEDFSVLFGLGADDRTLSPSDLAGIALAALRELSEVVDLRDAEITLLRQHLEQLEARVALVKHR